MRGTKRENLKNFFLSILLGIVVAKSITFQSRGDAFIIGYLVAHIAWVCLIVYDEIERKRRYSRKNHERMAGL